MYGLPITFKDDVELMEFAEKFVINDRIASLENDVERCIPDDKKEAAANAPFPGFNVLFFYTRFAGFIIRWKCKEWEHDR